ncbi:MAG: hypothetical protein ABI183_02370 [Polyangiaceae bacterium]
MEGTITVVEEKGSAGDAYLEFYVDKRTTRFRVPVDWYASSFDRASFKSAAHAGTEITFDVETTQLAKPLEPATDHVSRRLGTRPWP